MAVTSTPNRPDNTLLRRYPGIPSGGLPVVCIPHAGAGVSAYSQLAAALAPDIELLGMQPPGREDRIGDPRPGSLVELADVCADTLARELAPPYLILGHSIGALLGYEVARRLDPPPVALAASGCVPAHRVAGTEHPSPSDEELVGRMRRLGGVPPGLLARPDVLSLFLPVLRADLDYVAAYRFEPDPRAAFPILALGGADDPLVGRADMAEWAALTDGDFTLRILPGGHFFLFEHAAALSELLLAATVSAWEGRP